MYYYCTRAHTGPLKSPSPPPPPASFTYLHWVLQEELVVSQWALQAWFQQTLEGRQWLCDVHVLDDQVLVLWGWLLTLGQHLFLILHYTVRQTTTRLHTSIHPPSHLCYLSVCLSIYLSKFWYCGAGCWPSGSTSSSYCTMTVRQTTTRLHTSIHPPTQLPIHPSIFYLSIFWIMSRTSIKSKIRAGRVFVLIWIVFE